VNLSVDVNTLSPGVYLLRVSQDNRSRTVKFVKR
ncbi:MAG: T9SS type A sorting domain-containing protein, partial [Bacteroidetes bacterium]|nr:T9SS type A sorting domain-containing protein [Bacteroidota bacterium]